MALTRALAATGEQIEDSEVTVSSALAANVKAFLPAIEDGTGATVATGYQCLVLANAAGDVEIVDIFGRRVAMVQAGQAIALKANGDVNRPVWTVTEVANILQIGNAQPSAGSTTPALGTTCPAASATVKWIEGTLADGTAAFIPAWT